MSVKQIATWEYGYFVVQELDNVYKTVGQPGLELEWAQQPMN
jgi:hypothetical protein